MKKNKSKKVKKVIFLMGPTATGKTDLAICLSEELPCELISVDSALVYRGMDIGTAKPDKQTLEQYPHHLIDIRDPADPYSVADFRDDALRLIDDIMARDKIPLLVGGTMMYFNALVKGLNELPQADETIRQQLKQQADTHGWQALHDELQKVDTVSAQKIHPNDPQRLLRALEVYQLTGKPLSQHQQQTTSPLSCDYIALALVPENRDKLKELIAQRFNNMLEQGFISEVERLFQRGDLHSDLPAIKSVGYRQAWAYLQGEYDQNTMAEKTIAATRQLAKRQMTWLRSWHNLKQLDPYDKNIVASALKSIE